jgi:Mrp family chromosome partitioning ATPase
MSQYFEALQRAKQQSLDEQAIELDEPAPGPKEPLNRESAPAQVLTQLPIAPSIVGNIARDSAIRSLTERVAPLSSLGTAVRLLVSGCRPGDGASSVAGAIAMDLSQRLGKRTLLLDVHLRHPTLQRLFGASELSSDASDAPLVVRATRWPRMELGTCMLPDHEITPGSLLAKLDQRLDEYPMAVVDLGVVRLDSRMLALARPSDPILLVVRYGHTQRGELSTTVKALRAADRTPGGVIFNAARSSLPNTIHRIFGTGVRNEL